MYFPRDRGTADISVPTPIPNRCLGTNTPTPNRLSSRPERSAVRDLLSLQPRNQSFLRAPPCPFVIPTAAEERMEGICSSADLSLEVSFLPSTPDIRRTTPPNKPPSQPPHPRPIAVQRIDLLLFANAAGHDQLPLRHIRVSRSRHLQSESPAWFLRDRCACRETRRNTAPAAAIAVSGVSSTCSFHPLTAMRPSSYPR